ncbi:DNA polymerase V [bacterium]|nr:DNA polymerase V [bacterium]
MASELLGIKTTTTGFASPAESYVDKRLDLNDLIVTDVFSTFYFRYSGLPVYGINNNDVLVIDRSVEPSIGDLVVTIQNKNFKVEEYKNTVELWGKIVWVLSKK